MHRNLTLLCIFTAFLLAACNAGGTAEPTATAPAPRATAAAPTATVVASATTEGSATAMPPTAAATDVAPVDPTVTPPPSATPTFSATGLTLQLEAVADGFTAPIGVVSADDGSGRLFVIEKGGLIRIVTTEGSVLDPPFLDVSRLVSGAYEQGLLGLAFEPDRPDRFYINYTDNDGDTVIARYRLSDDPNVADSESGETLLTIDQPAANHNGGQLQFGPDGYLWIGMGDGGGAGDVYENAQNYMTLLGTLLRIDVSGERGYSVPSSNPFADGEGGVAEGWAFGLRNPWRFSFDRLTGELWIGDVGQGLWEEIDRAPSDQAAINYGWPILEAADCFQSEGCDSSGYQLPVTQYSHDEGCSVTGGYVYRGRAWPAMAGGYIFGDFCQGTIWAVASDAPEGSQATVLLETEIQISSFGEDEAGELYLTDFGDGRLYRLAVAAP
ncbi:MAG: PQQ-dependent sugar dehydrogenase [Anaerolineales bacterium]|nr:PQQ-dependent sugar dehydrogenase [Anaerolineales bacterium]